MWIYFVAMITIVTISSVITMYTMKKNAVLNPGIVSVVVFGSILVCAVTPLTFSRVSLLDLNILLSLTISIAVYIALIFAIAVLVSNLADGNKLEFLLTGAGEAKKVYGKVRNTVYKTFKAIMEEKVNYGSGIAAAGHTDGNSVAENAVIENLSDEIIEAAAAGEPEEVFEDSPSVLENTVASTEENDEKISNGREAAPEVWGYIDEAFRLKISGDLEGAILQYMYALDNKPENELVFWIVLDICTLYKELGQAELAREILESYISSYGNIMSLSIKNEISKNLLSS